MLLFPIKDEVIDTLLILVLASFVFLCLFLRGERKCLCAMSSRHFQKVIFNSSQTGPYIVSVERQQSLMVHVYKWHCLQMIEQEICLLLITT